MQGNTLGLTVGQGWFGSGGQESSLNSGQRGTANSSLMEHQTVEALSLSCHLLCCSGGRYEWSTWQMNHRVRAGSRPPDSEARELNGLLEKKY